MKQLDKAFNITPEVVKEEPKPMVKESYEARFNGTGN